MYIARILYPVEVLGPGKRIGIWFCGCPHHCEGCSNPELWEKQGKYRITKENLLTLIRSICAENPVDGFTITGGDPFYQAEALAELLPDLKLIAPDILVYTGYTLQELRARQSSEVERALRYISVLIDGRYMQEQNDGLALRGSQNQKIYFFEKEKQEKYQQILKEHSKIQNFMIGNSVISVGIHQKDYKAQLEQKLNALGELEDKKR
jgi:anaerobic ribonucleoside-triphosphate reductase activating protein